MSRPSKNQYMEIKIFHNNDEDEIFVSIEDSEASHPLSPQTSDIETCIDFSENSVKIRIKEASRVFGPEFLKRLQNSGKIKDSASEKLQNSIGNTSSSNSIQLELENLLFSPSDSIYVYPDEEIARRSPSIEQVKKLLTLLSKKSSEDQIHNFLLGEPSFIISLTCLGWNSPVAFISKPRIGSFDYKIPDFFVVTVGQGCGFSLHLIEIERSSHEIFNQDLQFSGATRQAIKQIRDWQQYLSTPSHQESFRKELLRKLRDLSETPFNELKEITTSFSLVDKNSLEQFLKDFQGHDRISMEYLIVIGRWSNLSERERARLVFENQESGENYKIITYDQMIKTAIGRPHELHP